MKKIFTYFILLVLSMGLSGTACSNKTDEETEKGIFEEMTDNAAKKAAKHLTAPVDRAREAQQLGQDHIDDIEASLDE